MNLSRAFHFLDHFGAVSFVGAGGKTTALFQLARELAKQSAVIVTSTTHLGVWQIPLADHHIIASDPNQIQLANKGITLITGELVNDRTSPVNTAALNWLHEISENQKIPLLIEADGSRQKPLKAAAAHEPPLSAQTKTVVVVAGLSALGKPLDDEHVQHAEIFSQLSGLPLASPISAEAVVKVLTHPQGGLKNIPAQARRVVFLNQADTPTLQSIGGRMARDLLSHFDSAVVGSLQQDSLQTFEPSAGILLAAGESSRFGAPKQLLDWKGKPFVRQVAETALRAGLDPVIVVTGSHAAEVESALSGLPVKIIYNPNYPQGQSTSIHAGLTALAGKAGSAVFLLADQPQIPAEVIRALIESHGQAMHTILAPLVQENRRANPVLFDRSAFPDLMNLKGDVGGREIFSKHRVEYLPWHDEILLLDVDQPQDYQTLKDLK